MSVLDQRHRPLRNLRLSVTDRCNLRCAYCMPADSYRWLPRPDLLTFEELVSLVRGFEQLGVNKVRLTGGEPLLRQGLPDLIRLLRAGTTIRELAMTTNGVLLAELAPELRSAGLDRVTVSIDTLRPDRFEALTRRNDLERVLSGIAAAKAAFHEVKLDAVVMRGVNEDEIVPLLHFAQRGGFELRFIEYMDVGGASEWRPEAVVSRAEILAIVEGAFGAVVPASKEPSAPADRFRLRDGTIFGIIASTSTPFCGTCDRARLTADGRFFRCLYASDGFDLREILRGGATVSELADHVRELWIARRDAGAEERQALETRAPLVDRDRLITDPHLEMHTRGG